MDEIGEDHSHELGREGAGRSYGRWLWSRGTQCAVDLGFAPVPDDTGEEVQAFAT